MASAGRDLSPTQHIPQQQLGDQLHSTAGPQDAPGSATLPAPADPRLSPAALNGVTAWPPVALHASQVRMTSSHCRCLLPRPIAALDLIAPPSSRLRRSSRALATLPVPNVPAGLGARSAPRCTKIAPGSQVPMAKCIHLLRSGWASKSPEYEVRRCHSEYKKSVASR